MDEEAIFLEALQKSSLQEQVAYLDQVCAGDPALHKSIEQLLTAHARRGDFLQDRPGLSPTDNHPVAECLGMVIGPYKLMEQLGEGGMGLVFVAEQYEPVRRRVALKVIKPGMDTREVIARFEAERQALALMDHPNIAKVLDAGTTGESRDQGPGTKVNASSPALDLRLSALDPSAGRPYFVMELVKGVPITQYCDDNRLTPGERLELFVNVCQAVQHAHLKGIIHRDIKPTNVMVTSHDGKPVVKVIDFGVAKAIGQQLTERTIYTAFSQMVGTPLYMSPEQAGMSGLDVDTRSDIYSLGVLLYELLTGTTPFDRQRLQNAAFEEVRRIIREEEPQKPSTRISTTDAAPSIAAQRHMEPAKLAKLMRGDLDWIVMKALEKDRSRRYETANGFAADVQRYLNDETVQAGPASASYRLRKFLRRNKGPVAAGVALAVLLLLGTVGTSIGLVWALQAERTSRAFAESEARQRRNAETQRDKAVTAEEQAVAEKLRANEEATIAKAVNDFLQNDLLAEAAPGKNAREKKVTVEELLGRAAARIAGKFEKQPRIEAAIMLTIGDAYRALGNYQAAQPHLEGALKIRQRVLNPEHPDVLASMTSLAGLYKDQAQFLQAESLYVKTLEVQSRVLGEEDPLTLAAVNNLALLYQAQGQYPKAEPLFIKALESYRRVLGEEHADTLISMNNLARLFRVQGQYGKAEPLFLETLEVQRRVLGDEHPNTLNSMNNLAVLYRDLRQDRKAQPLLVNALKVRGRVLGEEHPDTLVSLSNLAWLYQDQRQYAEAEPLLVKALEAQRRVLGEEHPNTISSTNNLAVLYKDQGQYAKAEPLFLNALEVNRRVLGEEHPNTLNSMNNLAVLYKNQAQYAAAEPLYVKALEVRRRVLGDEHPDTLVSLNNLGSLHQLQGQFSDAESDFVKALDVSRRVLGEEHPSTLTTMNNLAVLYKNQDQYAKAEPLYVKTLEVRRRVLGDEHPNTVTSINNLAVLYKNQSQFAKAEPLLRECLKIREQNLLDNWITFNTKLMLGESLLGQKKFSDAEPLLLAGYEGLLQREDKIPTANRSRLTEALERLSDLYTAWGRPDEADKWHKRLDERNAANKAVDVTEKR